MTDHCDLNKENFFHCVNFELDLPIVRVDALINSYKRPNELFIIFSSSLDIIFHARVFQVIVGFYLLYTCCGTFLMRR